MAGRGRGALIAALKEASSSTSSTVQPTNLSSDDEAGKSAITTTSSNASTSDKVLDSGLGTVTGSPVSGRGRLMGRGLLLSSTSSSSMVKIIQYIPYSVNFC